ncbi:hypothetical protein MRS44_004496 [Fusarium solani]|uniref:uncharacterized protein n=1 Tax=Fusarium solani TaxID=169388 RepID=UPI0032C41813|nr:hypothetical protein MRS44_004496 [Fusarium solani]
MAHNPPVTINAPLAPDLIGLAIAQLQYRSNELTIDPFRQAQRERHNARLTPDVLNCPTTSQQVLKQHRRENCQLNSMAAKLRTYNNLMAPSEPITAEQKRKCLLFRSAGWNYTRIAIFFNFTPRQAQYAILITEALSVPKGNTVRGQLPVLNHPQLLIVLAFTLSSRDTRRMEYNRLATSLGWRCKPAVIRNALREVGYERYPALIRPTIIEEFRQARFDWAQDHVDWTVEQWKAVVWSGETRIMTGPHARIHVTRTIHEARDPACIIDDDAHLQSGNTFWATFSGLKGKGPSVFWDPSWGTIDAKNHSERVLPTVSYWIQQQPDTAKYCMEHRPIEHSDAAIRTELQNKNMEVLQLPPASPDLDLMAVAWDMIKTKIEEDRLVAHLRGRSAVVEAIETWNWIEEAHLMTLIESMPARCQAVIDADGMYTPYN